MGMRLIESLAFRLLAMLSVALLPVGLIALYQTQKVVDQADALGQSALLGRTLVAVEPQRNLMHGGFAAVRTLAGAVLAVREDGERCSRLMQRFIQENSIFVLAMFIPEDGVSRCNSRMQPADLRRSHIYARFQNDPQPRVMGLDRGRISGQSVLVIAQPVFEDGLYVGYVSLSLPRQNIDLPIPYSKDERPFDLVTFNSDGEVLLALGGRLDVLDELPEDRPLRDLTRDRAISFTTMNKAGQPRQYSVVPIVQGSVYSFGSWDPNKVALQDRFVTRAALLFPIVMWLASLAVAYFAVHRLVIRHVRNLRVKMRAFASGRRMFSPNETHTGPAEFRQMEETFLTMAETISRDEADLENSLHEKNVLLKEIHHRVKNSLQLIASIMNMEIRKTSAGETRDMLKRLQDRVMGLATVHSNLYQTANLSHVRADLLLKQILNHTLTSALPPGGDVNVDIHIDPVKLVPDQAVPLSLLTTEAVTNAVKYIGAPKVGSAWICVKLNSLPEDRFELIIANSKGADMSDDNGAMTSTGLGNQLIGAFAMQLSSEVEIEDDADSYRLRCVVKIAAFEPAEDEHVSYSG